MKILFVDDDPNIINLYSVVLESICSKGELMFAHCPNEAIQILQNQKEIDLVISDFDMPPEGTGEEIYHYWKTEYRDKKKFMFFTSRETRELSFYDLDENNLHLKKPATLKEFKQFLTSSTSTADQEYYPVAIYQFARWKKTKVPVYLSLSDSHFVKVFNPDEEYDMEQLQKYMKAGKKYLYIKHSDEGMFLDSYDTSYIFSHEDNQTFNFETVKQNHNFINAQVQTLGITPQTVKTAQKTAEHLIAVVEKSNSLFELLNRALNSKDFSYDHSYTTICICSQLVDQMGIDKSNLKKLSISALLHDVKISSSSLAAIHDLEPNKIKELSSEEQTELKEHCDLSDPLKEIELFGDEIASIIKFHHSGDEKYPYTEHKKDTTQLSVLQCIFQASHLVACELYKNEFNYNKLRDILTYSQYKYSGKKFDKIWHTMEYIFTHKMS